MGKLSDSLQRTSDYVSADMYPSWTSLIITLAPIALRALFRRHERKQLKQEVGHHVDNYLTNYHMPKKAAKKERKAITERHGILPMTQGEFDKLPMKNGKRWCPPGFDYSDVSPGEIPCLFDGVDSSAKKGLKRISSILGKRSPISYLGNGIQWPPNSYFGDNVIIGQGSSIGARSVINGADVRDSVSMGPGCIAKGCTIGSHCKIGPNFTGLGGVVIGDNCYIGHAADLRPHNGTDVGGYAIGNNATIKTGFKIAGKDNVINNNAKIGPMSYMKGVNILKNGLSIDVGGVLDGCTFSDGTPEYPEEYTINRCVVQGNYSNTTLAHSGTFDACEFEGDVITVTGSEYNLCVFTDVRHIAGHSKLTGCRVTGDSATIIDGGTVNTGGALENTIINGKNDLPVKIINAAINHSELNYTRIEGDGSLLENVAINKGCEIKGAIRLDETVQIHSDFKIRQAVLSDEFKPSTFGQVTVSFYKTDINTDHFVFHKSGNDFTKFKFVSGNIKNLKTAVANHELITFGKGLFDGDIVKPTLDEKPTIKPIEIERPKPSSKEAVTNADEQPPVSQYDDMPPIESYDSVVEPSYQGYENIQQHYESVPQDNVEANIAPQESAPKKELSHQEIIEASPLAATKKDQSSINKSERQPIKGFDQPQNVQLTSYDAQSAIRESDENAKAKGVEPENTKIGYEFLNG